jgi:hypothetical protein
LFKGKISYLKSHHPLLYIHYFWSMVWMNPGSQEAEMNKIRDTNEASAMDEPTFSSKGPGINISFYRRKSTK